MGAGGTGVGAGGTGVGVGVGAGADPGAPTAKLLSDASVSPSASVTVSRTYLVSAFWNVLVILQPLTVSQTVEPSAFSKLQAQVRVPSPVDAVPSSVVRVPVVAPAGAVQMAFAGLPEVGGGVGVGVGVGVGAGPGVPPWASHAHALTIGGGRGSRTGSATSARRPRRGERRVWITGVQRTLLAPTGAVLTDRL